MSGQESMTNGTLVSHDLSLGSAKFPSPPNNTARGGAALPVDTHTGGGAMLAPASPTSGSRKRPAADSEVPQQQHRPFVPHDAPDGMLPGARMLGGAQQVSVGAGGLYALPQNYASGRFSGGAQQHPVAQHQAAMQQHMQMQYGGYAPPQGGGYAPAQQQEQPPQRPKQSGSTHPSMHQYSELYARLPTVGGEAGLISEFLRDELRSLLKANRVSYHKGGPQNLMKSKAEMAADLLQLIIDGKLQENPPPITEEEANRSHASRGKKKKKKAQQQQQQPQKQQRQQRPSASMMPAPEPRLRSPGPGAQKWGRASPMSPSPPPPPLTPRTRAAAEIILTFPPTTPRARQRIMEAMEEEADQL